jgi:TonB family protein
MSWLDHALVEALGLSLLHFLWQGALIGLLYAASLPLMQGASAQSRYVAAVIAMALLALAPPVTLAVLLDGAAPTSAAVPNQSAAVSLSGFAAGSTAGQATSIMHWIVAAWLAGVIVLSVRLLMGWQFLRRLRRSADRTAAESLAPRLTALARRLKIGRPVAVAVSDGIRSPVVIGWLKPLVLLPPAVMTGLPTRQLEMVLAHELAHVRRLDHLVNLCQTVVETILFYHPVVRWVSRRIRVERENACDDLAVAVTDDRLAYVEMLASLEKLRFRGPRLALAVHDGQMLSRIRRLVERGRPDRQLGLTGPAMLLALVVAAVGGLQFVGDEAERPANDPPSESVVTEAEPAPEPETAPARSQETPPPPAVAAPAAENTLPTPAANESARLAQPVPAVASPEPAGTQAEIAGGSDPATVSSEPPALPKMETDRLPPASEWIDRSVAASLEQSAGRELAMLERPALAVPELPAAPRPRAKAAEAARPAGGKLLERIEPEYPVRARQRGIDGSVEVEFLVTRNGSVSDVRVLDETPRGLSFGESAREAIADWRFEPFRENDRPIDHRVRLEVTFDLGDEPERECRKVLGSRIPRCY